MRALIKMLATAAALAMSTGAAFAVMGKTTTDVALRVAPAAQAELIVNIPEGALLNVGSCSRGWCGVTFYNYGGYLRESALQFQSTPAGGPRQSRSIPPTPTERATIQRQKPITTCHPMPPPTQASIVGAFS